MRWSVRGAARDIFNPAGQPGAEAYIAAPGFLLPDLALGWPVGAFSRGGWIGWTIPRLRCGRERFRRAQDICD